LFVLQRHHTMSHMAKSLRGFVDQLRTRSDFIEIDKPVRPHEFDVTAILKQLEDSGHTPAVLFKHPTDLEGRPSEFSILSNIHASRARYRR